MCMAENPTTSLDKKGHSRDINFISFMDELSVNIMQATREMNPPGSHFAGWIHHGILMLSNVTPLFLLTVTIKQHCCAFSMDPNY